MTEDKKTRITDESGSSKPDEQSPEEILKQKFQRLQGNYDRLDQEHDRVKKDKWILEENLQKETKKYDIFAAKTEEEKKQLKKKSIYTGLMSAAFGAGIAAAILGSTDCSCSGGVGSLRSSYRSEQDLDAGVVDTDARDAGVSYGTGIPDAGAPKAALKCSDIQGCYDQKYVDDLEEKWNTCEDTLRTCNDNLEACLQDKIELSKRPESCPPTTYVPRACAPVKECPKIPYIRRGE